ncbi:MAG: BatA domain-containing protein [Rhodothermaceae bacterium]
MTFLNPAILFGIFAAALPLIIHLFNIRKVQNVEFSTLMFLKEIQKNKIRKVKLKQWLLLFLRTLLIILLVMAFARPTLETVTIGNNSSTKSSVVFLVDDSFSLQLKNEKGSGFNQVKTRVKSLVQKFKESDEVSVITFSGKRLSEISGKKELDLFLDQLETSSRKSDFKRALQQAIEITEKSQNLLKEVYIVSDFQKNLIKNIYDLKFTDEKVKVFLVNADFENIDNLAVTNFRLENKILTKGKKINFSAEIYNTTSNKLTGKVASLFINGVRKAQKSFDIEANGKVLLEFETLLENTGLINAFVELEDDVIQTDNRNYLSFIVPEKLKVLILRDNPYDTRFIETVLDEQVSSYKTELTVKSSDKLNYVRLQNFDVVFLVGNKNIDDSKEIKKYLQDGGNLVYFVSSTPNLEKINKFLASVGKFSVISINHPAGGINGYFEKVDFRHPVFNDLFAKEKLKFSSPVLQKYIKIKPDPSADKIISLLDGSPVLLEKETKKGKILLFSISPEISFSNFPVKGIFAPVINKILMYCGTKVKKDNQVTAGEKIMLDYNKIVNNSFKVVYPDNGEEFVNTNGNYGKKFYEYSGAEKIGNYKFYSNNKLIDYFSVNFDPSETDLRFLTKGELEKLGKEINPKGVSIAADLNDNFDEIINKNRTGTELWQYFLIAALFVALVEMFVARGVKKDLAAI